MLNWCNCICACIRVHDKCMLAFDTHDTWCMGCECWEGQELRMSVCVKWISFVHIKWKSFPMNLRMPYQILSGECMDFCFEQTSTSIASRRDCRQSVPQPNDRFGVTERLQPHRTRRHIFRRMSLAIESDILNLSGPLTPSLSPLQESLHHPCVSPSLFLPSSVSTAAFPIWNLNRRITRISQDSSTPCILTPKARVPKAHFLPPLG